MESQDRENGDLGQRGPAEIEREIAGTRAALESTVEELGERLRPGQMVDDARTYVREKASRSAIEAWESLRVRIRDNPVPLAALIGGGIVWYVMKRRANGDGGGADRYAGYARDWANGLLERRGSVSASRMARASELGTKAAARASELGTQVAARAGELGAQAAERARDVTQRAREASADLGARVQDRAGFGRPALASFLEERPLLIGVAGFALGAVVGGAVPFARRAADARAEAGREQPEAFAPEAMRSLRPDRGDGSGSPGAGVEQGAPQAQPRAPGPELAGRPPF